MDDSNNIKSIPYTATSLSVIGRFIFMYLLYRNKSKNTLSLIFCLLSTCSSSLWIFYSININDLPMIVRSSTEILLLLLSIIYIVKNKLHISKEHSSTQNQVLPT